VDGTGRPAHQYTDGYYCREPGREIWRHTATVWWVCHSKQPALESWFVFFIQGSD